MLKSQEMRTIAVEMDALKQGMGWTANDLSKPQIFIQSTYGDSHPGSVHLNRLVKAAEKKFTSIDHKAAKYYTTDICDGIAQGHDGMNYSLLSREAICNMIEIQAKATPFDGGMFICSCDKGIPAHLKAIARLDMPSIVVTGGVMKSGPNMLTLEQIGTYNAMLERHEITPEAFTQKQSEACPTCGACQFMGTAITMQVMTEALGLCLPGVAVTPAVMGKLDTLTEDSALALAELIKKDIKPSDILTKEAFENAIMVHAAVAGSSNVLLHLPAIAYELGIEITADDFDRIHRQIPYLANVRPSGKYPSEFFWYAGGVPMIMSHIKAYLHLDVMTVTGKTLGENLEALEASHYFETQIKQLEAFDIDKEDVIKPLDRPIQKEGAIAVLKGNLAPEGAVIKHSAVDPSMHQTVLRARVFESEEYAYRATIDGTVKPGDAVVIKNEGPKGSGMPEMFYTTEAIASNPKLIATTALITDGRFSGATRGPAIGHISPEACVGGPIGLVEEGDLIEIDIPARGLNIVGIANQKCSQEHVEKVLEERRSKWKPPVFEKGSSVLNQYRKLAVSAIKGGYIE
jgi:dihydroxy-acid dehydratase